MILRPGSQRHPIVLQLVFATLLCYLIAPVVLVYHVGQAHTDILHSYNLFCSFVFTHYFLCFCVVSPAVPVNRGGQTPMDILQSYNTSTMSTRLQITAPIGLTQGYLTRLFSLIPGLEYCDLNETTGKLLYDLYPWIFIQNERYSVESLSLYS